MLFVFHFLPTKPGTVFWGQFEIWNLKVFTREPFYWGDQHDDNDGDDDDGKIRKMKLLHKVPSEKNKTKQSKT